MKQKINTVFDCSLVNLSKVDNKIGSITVIENGKNIAFDVKRVYYLYDIPGGEERGGHAHYELQQYIIAASGSFDVILDDSINSKTVTLNRPNFGLHIVPGIWRKLNNFSSGSISLVLASNLHDEKDYIRNYEDFLNFKEIKN